MSKRENKKSPVLLIIMLILAIVVVYSFYQIVVTVLAPDDYATDATSSSKTITVNGKNYFPRQDITVFMLMGIDRTGPVVASDSYNNTGAVDMIALAVFDETNESYSVVMLNRDTMMDIPILGIGGKPAGSMYGQLALSHTYGTGLEDSCENTKKAVSNFLGGLQIDHYLSMNMDSISILNDAVGGVKVNVTDDFSQVDPSIPMGETVLHGDQALSFVRTRKDVADQMNISRMERHKEYMDGFLEALDGKLEENESFVLKTYDAMDEYIVSDCSIDTLSTMINRYSDYTFEGAVSPEGENVKGDKYMEFHVDEAALDDMILRMFYSEK